MTALKNRTKVNLLNDVEKIKAAILDTSNDLSFKAGEMLNDSIEDIKDRTSAAKESVENYTSEKPLKSLGFAFLAGLVIGYLAKK